MVDFSQNLKRMRLNAGMTQLQLAKRLGVSSSVVSYYEQSSRTPSPEILVKLSEIFHVTTDYMLGIEYKKLIDVSDLNDEDMELLLNLIETLRKKNGK